jgi:hypothetical protein
MHNPQDGDGLFQAVRTNGWTASARARSPPGGGETEDRDDWDTGASGGVDKRATNRKENRRGRRDSVEKCIASELSFAVDHVPVRSLAKSVVKVSIESHKVIQLRPHWGRKQFLKEQVKKLVMGQNKVYCLY